MTVLSLFALLAPEALLGLLALPVLWVLLRLTPPPPKTVVFPPLRLLAGLTAPRPVAERTPLWVMILRMMIVVLGLLGLAHPILPGGTLIGPPDVPLLVVLDSGWSAAPGWDAQRQTARRVLDQAARLNRSVMVVGTAAGTPPAVLESAAQAIARLESLTVRPWPAALPGGLAPPEQTGVPPLPDRLETVWISDGLLHPAQKDLLEVLQRRGPVRVVLPETGPLALLLTDVTRTPDGVAVTIHLPQGAGPSGRRTVVVRGDDPRGQTVAAVSVTLGDSPRQTVVLPVPADAMGEIRRVRVTGAGGDTLGAGAQAVLDDRWRRRPIGLIETGDKPSDLPLLSASYYLRRALGEGADLRAGPLASLLDQRRAVLILPGGQPPAGQAARLEQWVRDGGVLIRFADADLADQTNARSGDPLLPVPLRAGGRSLGGQLSWEKPLGLAPFPPDGPLAGLVAAPDVTVTGQILAEPLADLANRTWARLSDGTPLVTGARLGQGWLILVHTTANTDWGTLPLSGVFPQMVGRLIAVSSGVGTAGGAPEGASLGGAVLLPPQQVLDGMGAWQVPGPEVRPLPASGADPIRLGPQTPPGLYGREGGLRAVSVSDGVDPVLTRLEHMPRGVAVSSSSSLAADRDMRGVLFAAALVLLVLDGLCGLWLRGGRVRVASAVLAVIFGVGGITPPAQAADPDLEAALETRLGWISSGAAETDRIVQAGLVALTKVLAQRTAAELGEPAQVQPDSESLSLYPLIYWAIGEETPTPDDRVRLAVARYLDRGGLIVFDARGPEQAPALRRVVQALDLPPVARLPADHVLTRSFYLLPGLPGRLADAAPWIGQAAARGQGVSPVVIGAADWAGAWARDGRGRALLPALPGGERQRELAFRSGVNLVMYALTGDYKADQVHLPAIMERLTQ